MALNINRRDFLKLAGIGGVTFASGLGCYATRGAVTGKMSDSEIGLPSARRLPTLICTSEA